MPEAHAELSQTSKMELFEKSSISDAWLGFKSASEWRFSLEMI